MPANMWTNGTALVGLDGNSQMPDHMKAEFISARDAAEDCANRDLTTPQSENLGRKIMAIKLNEIPSFRWVAYTDGNEFAKTSVGGESFWISDVRKHDDGSYIGKVCNNLICTDVHGLVFGDEVRFAIELELNKHDMP